MRKGFVLAAIVLAGTTFAGCGDPPNSDPRTLYSKAPLERPGVRIQGETPSEVARFGTPNLIPSTTPGGGE